MNYDEKGRVHFKVIVWGPFASGKTTMIKWYYNNALDLNRGGFTSVENNLGQTIYFDYASLSTNTNLIYDFFAVGGSDECARERRTLAEGADAVIFVAHSQRDRLESTLSSVDELVSLLGKAYESMPKIFVLNKRDLLTEDLIEEGEFSELPDIRGYRVFETVANIGVGVADAFQYLISDLTQRTRALPEIPRAPQELKGIAVAILGLAQGFEAALEAVYPDTFLMSPEEARAVGSMHPASASTPSFATVQTGKISVCSYSVATRDELGTSHILCLVLPSTVARDRFYGIFERFRRSAPVILRYKDLSSLKELSKTMHQFHIITRDLMTSRAAGAPEQLTLRPREAMRCKLLAEGASGAIDKGVSYVSLLQDQQEYELLYSPSKRKAAYTTSVHLDEYETKSVLKEVERLQNNLSARLRATAESGSRRKHVEAYLAEMRNTLGGVYSRIFGNAILEMLVQDDPDFLTLEVERHLYTIPLELLHDGQDYLCLRKPFSRWITGEQGLISSKKKPKLLPKARKENEPLSILIVDSRLKKIPPVSREDFAGRLITFLKAKGSFGKLEVAVVSARGELRKDDVKVLLSSSKFDVIHLIAPAEISSGDPMGSSWVFSNGEIRGYELAELFAEGHPRLIISHVSSPSRQREWDANQENRITYSLAMSALAAGTECFLGVVAQQLTESSLSMTIALYQEILKNKSIGEALRAARLISTKTDGFDENEWMKPVLYGNPAKHIA